MKLSFPVKIILYPSFPVLFPFLIPIDEMLNISMFPKDSIAFFQKFVGRMKENHLDSKQKWLSHERYRFDSGLGCEHVNYVFPFICH